MLHGIISFNEQFEVWKQMTLGDVLINHFLKLSPCSMTITLFQLKSYINSVKI